MAEGDALFRPNEERGREHIREYISSSDEPWKDTYNDEDFVLREGGEIQVVKESVSSLDFHFDVKKGNLTVKFQWGAGEQPDTAVPALPENITEQIAIKQAFSVDVSEAIPEGLYCFYDNRCGDDDRSGCGENRLPVQGCGQ